MKRHHFLAQCVIVTLITVFCTVHSSECPPDGIYLMLGGKCIANGTWFSDSDLETTENGSIHCVLPNETLNGGQWLRPDGQPVNCTTSGIDANSNLGKQDIGWTNPFYCTTIDSPNATITMYLVNDDYFSPTIAIAIGGDIKSNIQFIETEYKCCLPTDCSDPNTNIVTINVFERVYIIDVYVDPPSDITVIPQYYTVHCIVTGVFKKDPTITQYYNDGTSNTELSQSYCANTQYNGYSCTVNSTSITTYKTYDDTRDYTVTVKWEGESISDGVFRQSANEGDHVHLCTATGGAIKPEHKGRSESITVRVPSSSSTILNVIHVTLTSITIDWSYPTSISDVDGYVINASSINDYVIQQVTSTSSTGQTTLNGLLPGTNYTITVRAYQDILGPPSNEISVTTDDAPSPVIMWSRLTPITGLLNTVYSIQCTVDSNVNTSLVYWNIDGAKMFISSPSLNESDMTYTSELHQVHLNNELGQSVTITCSIEGARNTTLVLEAPPMSPQDVSVTQPLPYDSNISISWSTLPSVDGFIVTVTPGINNSVYEYNNTTTQVTITGLTPNVLYTITVYSYNDLISAGVSKNITIVIQQLPSTSSTLKSTSVFSSSTNDTAVSISTIPPSLLLSSPSTTTASTTVPTVTPTTSSTTGDPGSDSTLPIVVGVVVGGIVLLIIIMAVIVLRVFFARKKHHGDKEEKHKDETRIPLGIINEEFADSKSEDGFILAEKPLKEVQTAVTLFYDEIPPEVTSDEPVKLDQLLETTPTSDGDNVDTTEDNIADTTGVTLIDEDDEDDQEKEEVIDHGESGTGAGKDPLYISIPPKEEEGTVVPDVEFDNQIPMINPIRIDEFRNYVNERDVQNLQHEFKVLYTGDERAVEIGSSKQNMALNRFKNVLPYDDNRVVLKTLKYEGCDGDFINASYVDGYSMPRKFIAAQGPLRSTLKDFFRLVWMEKVHIIVMVTNLREGGRSKCEQYWPLVIEDERDTVEQFGPFIVKMMSEMKYPEYTMRTFQITFENESREVTQYQLTSWPDHGVLEYPSPLILVHKRVMNKWQTLGGPLLVHCSAGVGRTGTFITMDIALEQAKRKGVVDIAGIVTRLRQQRTKMVQTEDQYIFLHDAVLEELICGDTEINSNQFVSRLQELKQSSVLKSQFSLLEQFTPDPDEVITDSALAHPEKNRSSKYLPADKHIVPLLQRDGYINATFVKAYNHVRGMIITQSPMESTTEEFWKMIMQYKVSAIVMCCELTEEGEETCYQYWPSTTDESKVYGNFEVTLHSQTDNNGFICRQLKVTSVENVDTQLTVTQFQVGNWPSSGVVSDSQSLVMVLESVINVQKKMGGGPIVVHCSDTVSRSGVYCAVSNTIEQCKAEGVVDVFQTVKTLRMNKPGAVTTLDQYITVYDAALTFLDANQLYANFL